jgi:hypothetical protein
MTGKIEEWTFESIDAFYAARGGKFSRECDYGVWWSDNPQGFPRYRVSYVKDTGDVYAINQTTGRVEVLGTVEPDPIDERDFRSRWEGPLDDLLEGWPDRCGPPGGLAWVRSRLAR